MRERVADMLDGKAGAGIGVAAVLLFAFSVTAVQPLDEIVPQPEDTDSTTGLTESVDFTNPVVIRKNGEVVATTTNVLMDGEEAVEVMLSTTGTDVAWDTIALGEGSAPADGSTSLDGEKSTNGLSPKTATVEDVGDGEWNLTATFTAQGTDTVNTTAVKSTGTADSSIDYLAGTDFGRNLNVQDGDEIQVEWNFQVTG